MRRCTIDVVDMERALVTLTSSESKRLIGKGVANLPEVKNAFRNGIVFIATSTTNAFVAEELLNKTQEDKGFFTVGVVVPKGLCVSSAEKSFARAHSAQRYIGIKHGKASPVARSEMRGWLAEMGPDDVFIKGANAIDATGAAGILLGNPLGRGQGGTISTAIGTLNTRGVKLIIPAGLEKLVPGSLVDVAPGVGGPFRYAAGLPSGMMVVKGKLMTEIEAFHTLTETRATPIAAGGINGAEGCQTMILEGKAKAIDNAWSLIKSIKGEPALTTITVDCDNCNLGCDWNKDPDLIDLRRRTQSLT